LGGSAERAAAARRLRALLVASCRYGGRHCITLPLGRQRPGRCVARRRCAPPLPPPPPQSPPPPPPPSPPPSPPPPPPQSPPPQPANTVAVAATDPAAIDWSLCLIYALLVVIVALVAKKLLVK